MAQFGEKSLVHHHGTGAVLYITNSKVVRGTSWTRHLLSDAWDATNWDVLGGAPWQMVTRQLTWTQKVVSDRERAGPPMPRIAFDIHRSSRGDNTCCLLTLTLTAKLEVVWVVQRWHRMEERQDITTMNVESESEQLLREPGWARRD